MICTGFQPGFTISKPDQKPVLTGFDGNRENQKKQSVFGTQFEFQILKKKNQKPSNFFDLPVGFFWFIDRFLTGFYLKFNF
jgi:hypothetical protein